MISTGVGPGSRSATRSRWTSRPAPPRPAISASDLRNRPAAPNPGGLHQPASVSSRLASISFFPVNGSPICTVGRLSSSSSERLLAGQDAGATQSAPGRGAVESDEVAGPGRARSGDVPGRQEADAHRVDEGVVPVERRRTPPRRRPWDADTVAVVADAADGPVEPEVLRAGSEARRGARPGGRHRDDVTEDAAHPVAAPWKARRRTRWLALHLERAREALAEVDDPGVLTQALQDRRTLRGKPPRQPRRVLVPQCSDQRRKTPGSEVVPGRARRAFGYGRLLVGEAEERAVERLFRHEAQGDAHSIARAGARDIR